MEKVTFEIEFSTGEFEVFDSLMEKGCYDKNKYVKRLIIGDLNEKALEDHARKMARIKQ